MTTFDRFDPVERRIGAAMDDIAGTRPLDYLDDVFRQTARTAQRPRWSFPERWLNVDTAFARPVIGRRVPFRLLIVLALLAALAASAAVYFGSQQPELLPYGPAANGRIAYVADGDIYVRDTLTGEGRPLVSGPIDQFAPAFSPDGTRISYVENDESGDHFFVANADGSNAVSIADIPQGNAQAAWAPDSRAVALVYDLDGSPALLVASESNAWRSRVFELPGLKPWDVAWQPPAGRLLLFRAEDVTGRQDLYAISPDTYAPPPTGSSPEALGLSAVTDFGAEFTLSGSTWSPDGTTIAYNGIDRVIDAQRGPFQHFRVHLVAADGSGDRALPGPADLNVQENWPVWSPDGRSIAVIHWQFTDSVAGTKSRLAVMPADGSSPAREIGPRFDSSTEDAGLEKAWSPDGTRILLSVGSTGQVFSVDPVSGDFVELPWASALPDWQRVAR